MSSVANNLKLSDADIPGSSLSGRAPANLKVQELKFWLKCRGDPAKGHVIRAGGALVLGQEQDSVGGSFEVSQSFIGEMTGVNIWDHVIKDQDIARMSKSCLTGVGNVFQWRDFKAHIKGSVKITKPSC
ncbi:neuronal pentraxin-2-like [Stylophora pistillata]|uniref:Neuronal pentraxin-2 n=1 Tax=Stylophora pistillata TaxID=50429 RepID=A0A2B4SYN8_STYPI|nr:neuronal pentraxin-2-like [Stylophora pistillata]PFX33547.1 Neuronal pentraxin-2 [Stylophora pistillata]